MGAQRRRYKRDIYIVGLPSKFYPSPGLLPTEMKQERSFQRHRRYYLYRCRYVFVLAVILLVAYVISIPLFDTSTEDDAALIAEPPNLVLLEILDVFEQICSESDRSKLGHLLLEDDFGVKMKLITAQISNDVREVNREICIQWLWGKGRKPVTWRTFIDAANETGFVTLASDIFKQIDAKYYDAENSPIDYNGMEPKALIKQEPNVVMLEKIGVFDQIHDYSKFGTLLLDDEYDTQMQVIIANHKNVYNINRQVCIYWLWGYGQQPVTWRTFLNAVNATGLKLADDIFQLIDANFLNATSCNSLIHVDPQLTLIREPPNLVILEKLHIVDLIHDYNKIGILLLEDDHGIKMKMITHKFGNDVQNIHREIISQWLWGRGRQPVTWRTFIHAVNSSGFSFADDLANLIDTKYLNATATHLPSGIALIQEPPSLVVFEKLDMFNLIHDYSKIGLLLLEDTFGMSMKDITRRNNNDIHYINKEICQQWLSGKGKQPVSWRTFIATISKTHTQLANDLLKIIDIKYLDVNSSLYTHPSIIEAITSSKTDYYRQALFDFNVTVVDLHFLNVSLRYTGRHSNHTNMNIWEVLNEINYSEVLLITGQPGAGKTTLMRYLAKMWADGSTLKTCQMLFYISLKDGESIISLESLLRKSPNHLVDTKSIAEEIELKRGTGVCFLIDSYEWNYDYVYQLLQGNKLYKSLRIITARPKELLMQGSLKHLEIIGFNKNDLPQYLDEISSNQTLNKLVLTMWNKQPNVKELCTLPLLFSMVLSIIKGASDESPLETRTQIYMLFIFKAISQSKVNRPYHFMKLCLFESGPPNELCTAFHLLLNVAFQMTFNDQISFPDDERDEILLMLQNTGFVTTELTGHMNRRKFTFSHPTFGEFFAALHLALESTETQYHYATLYREAWFSVFKFFFGIQSALQLTGVSDTSSVLQRIAMHYSTKPWHASKQCSFQYSIEFFEIVSELEEIHKNALFQKSGIVTNFTLCVYSDTYGHHNILEFKNETAYQIQYSESTTESSVIIDHYSGDCRHLWSCLQSGFNESDLCTEFPCIISFYFTVRNNYDSVRLQYMLQAFTNLQSLHLDVSPISSNYELIAKVLANLRCVDDLTLSGIPVNYNKLPCVKRLALVGDKYYSAAEHSLPNVTYSPLLQFLVRVFQYHRMWKESGKNDLCAIMPIEDTLKYPDKLQMLAIEGTSLRQGCTNFTSILSGLAGLKHLHIIDVNVVGSNLETFLRESTLSPKLLTLELSSMSIKDSKEANILKGLPKNLHNLIFNDCVFSNYSLQVLSESLKMLTNLHSLTLTRNHITSEDLQLLVNSLGNSLQTLNLAYNSMIFEKREGLEVLSQLSNLQHLNLTGCKIDEKHVSLLYQVVSKFMKLESLSLCQCTHDPLKKEFREDFIRGITHLTELKYFSSSNCF